jgi:hypothetical protein
MHVYVRSRTRISGSVDHRLIHWATESLMLLRYSYPNITKCEKFLTSCIVTIQSGSGHALQSLNWFEVVVG